MKPQVIREPSDLGRILAEIHASQRSMYLQILRQAEPFIGIGMLEGMIVYLKCALAEGEDVLPILSDLKAGDKILFWPPRANQVSPTLPEISAVLQALKTPAPVGTAPSSTATPIPRPGLITDETPRSPGNGTTRPRAFAAARPSNRGANLEQFVAVVLPTARQYLGPIADLFLDEILGRYPGPISRNASSAIIRELAANLSDPARLREFVVAAEAKLRAMY